jgi:hypothetical protein
MGLIYADVALYYLRLNGYVPRELNCISAMAFYKNVIAQPKRGKLSIQGSTYFPSQIIFL